MSPADLFRRLRAAAALKLPATLPSIDADGDLPAVLAQAYCEDARAWPGEAPPFHAGVANWGVDMVLRVAHRWYAGADDTDLPPAPASPTTIDAAAGYHLSADVALRYLPPLLARITDDSPDDVLLAETAPLRSAFPFTFLLAPKPAWPDALPALRDRTFRGAVVDRVIERDRLGVAQHPDLRAHVETALGAHAETLWPRFHRMRGAPTEE